MRSWMAVSSQWHEPVSLDLRLPRSGTPIHAGPRSRIGSWAMGARTWSWYADSSLTSTWTGRIRHIEGSARALARECRLIQFDKRGTGLSDPASALPTVDQRRDDLVAVLDTARSRRAFVLGLSDGGRAAIAFGASYQDRTAELILYGTSYRRPPSTIPALQDMLQHWGEGHIVDVYAPEHRQPRGTSPGGDI